MRKVADIAKQSKKAQKAFYAAKRGTWGRMNPDSRVVPDKKKYTRCAAKAAARREMGGGSFFATAALTKGTLGQPIAASCLN